MSSMPEALSRLPAGCMWNWRYSRNQSAILTLLARANSAHHQATGFDRACNSNLMRRSAL